jgi:hypothetical protein
MHLFESRLETDERFLSSLSFCRKETRGRSLARTGRLGGRRRYEAGLAGSFLLFERLAITCIF